MQSQYSEVIPVWDSTELENAVREHVRDRQKRERETRGQLVSFPGGDDGDDLPDAA